VNAPTRWGHPRALSTLFYTELWERFSFYGMRGLLVLYMTTPLTEGGLGFDLAHAAALYGLYSGLVYLACLPGGWLADRFLGSQRATWWGGLLILLGHVTMAWPASAGLYPAMGLLVCGTGLLKPSVSSMVGQLYASDDPRRDSGYSLYYMGINLGAFLAPLICGWLALAAPVRERLGALGLPPSLAWHAAFGAAALGMALGLWVFLRGRADFPVASARPAQPPSIADWRLLRWVMVSAGSAIVLLAAAVATGRLSIATVSDLFGSGLLVLVGVFFVWALGARHWTPEERHNLRLIVVLFLGAVVFWALFEQGSSTLTLFAQHDTDRFLPWLGYDFPATWFHSVNPLLIILGAPLFAWGWLKLGPRNPSASTKFLLGLALASAGFAVLILAARVADTGVKVSPAWLLATYVLHSLGELCLSPVGLSAMSRLAPARIGGLTMGVWFLAASVGNYLGGRVAGLYENFTRGELFMAVSGAGLAAAVVLAGLFRWLGPRRLET
jgi:POT family proton-dependent oligopeptide transporter